MKLSVSLALCFICSFAFAQVNERDSSFVCNAKWKRGEQKTLLIRRIKRDYERDSVKSTFAFEYEAAITVMDSSKDGYKVQWVFHLPAKLKEANPQLAQSMPVYEGLKMIFTTTNSGTFKELLNWEEVKDAYVRMAEVSLPPKPDDKQKEVMDKTKEMFNSKEMVEGTLINEIQLYHVLYGASFTTKGHTEQSSVPSPFSADEIPATIESKIAEMSAPKDYVNIVTDQKIDMIDAGKIIEGFIRKMGLPEDSVMKMAKDLLAKFEINDHRGYTVTASTGWISKVVYQRTVRSNDMKKTETYLIEMKN